MRFIFFLLKILRKILAPRFFLCLISFFFKILFSSQLSKCFDILPKGVVAEFFMGKEAVVMWCSPHFQPDSPIHQFPNFQIFNSADIAG